MNTASLQLNRFYEGSTSKYSLCVRQQPSKARLCSFKDKVDRRPLDPPPIVQLLQNDSTNFLDYQNSSNFFLHTTLASAIDDSDIHTTNSNRTTAGVLVQSLHKLKDVNNTEGAFFIFPDISVRIEDLMYIEYAQLCQIRLKFTLQNCYLHNPSYGYSSISRHVSLFTSPHFIPESTLLTRSFSDQGVRIRIRKEARVNSPSMKRPRDEPSDREQTPSSSNVMSMQNLLINDATTSPPYITDSPRPLRQLPSPHSLPFTHSSGFYSQLPLPRQNLSDSTARPPTTTSFRNRFSVPQDQHSYRST